MAVGWTNWGCAMRPEAAAGRSPAAPTAVARSPRQARGRLCPPFVVAGQGGGGGLGSGGARALRLHGSEQLGSGESYATGGGSEGSARLSATVGRDLGQGSPPLRSGGAAAAGR